MPVYLISKAIDPLFAVTIGSTAALLRIRREEREKKSPESAGEIGFGDVFAVGGERVRRWWAGEFDGRGVSSSNGSGGGAGAK